MNVAFYVTLVSGLLALIGLVGIISGASMRGRMAKGGVGRAASGQRVFRTGAAAMTMAGLVGILAGVFGIVGTDQIFGGLMMLIFGTAVSLPKQGSALNRAAPAPIA